MSINPELREIATTRDGRDITRPYMGAMRLMPPADSVLTAKGGNYAIYEDILRDDQVKACLQQRQLAVVSKSWVVEAGDDRRESRRAADDLRATLTRLPWDDITSKMLLGVYYGYAVAECLWSRQGEQVTLDAIKVRKQRRFGFSPDGQLLLLTASQPLGEAVPERKFWHFNTGADNDDEAYGLGLAHWLYWPVVAKRGGMTMWTSFLDKFGIPTVKGTYNATASAEERARLLQAIEVVQSDAGVILPEGMTIELLEATRGGSPGYDGMVGVCNAAIAKVILSQTMTTDNGASLSQAEVHYDVRHELVESDADLICGSFNNTVAKWLTEWNHPTAATPRVRRETEAQEDLTQVANRIETLDRAGWQVAEDAEITRIFGGKWQRKSVVATAAPTPESLNVPQTPAQFAEAQPPTDAVDTILSQAMTAMPGILTGMTDQIQQLVLRTDSWESLRGELLAMYPDLDATALADLMAQALTLAELAGRWDVSRGR